MTARMEIYLDIAGREEAMGVALLAIDRAVAATVRENILIGSWEERLDAFGETSRDKL